MTSIDQATHQRQRAGEKRPARLASSAGLGAGSLALICYVAGARAALLLLVPGGFLLLLGLWLDRPTQRIRPASRVVIEIATAIGWIAIGFIWGLR